MTSPAAPLTAIDAFHAHATDEQVGLLRFLQLGPDLGLALLVSPVSRLRELPAPR
ncbi:hypothetical protein OG455_08030 [Kitasatospora sp. NBC_01287]|uniref:hypothetical protein n=1 Tax=Kitasatospora sp. NBC_01287 TaxID=2903573 RepID=UPI002253AE21|nr:hypothetical protein [Kitasatospora sp. NBC_01287]MCX4745470.1 hypothetical protein [Kitasatospora sp. NBC_01287]